MSVHIQAGNMNLEYLQKEIIMQSMPFTLAADCNAKISTYFKPYVKKEQDMYYMASFRGYPLIGKKIDLPGGYVGAVLHEKLKPTTDIDDRNLYLTNKFNSFMHWNWDKSPTQNDAIIQVISNWIEIAEIVGN